MKILVAHNRYRSDRPSGENAAVDSEVAALREHGAHVVRQDVSSDVIGAKHSAKVQAAVGPVFAPEGVRRFQELLAQERPDIVHLHNVFPLISPWVIRVAANNGIPVVQTVHNYRHTCVAGLHFRDGNACFDCPSSALPLPAVQHACYRGSRLQSVAMAAGQVLHRRTWGLVSHFFAVSQYQAEYLVRLGLPSERLSVKANVVPDSGPPRALGRDVVFVGRLDEAKGVRQLLDAWVGLRRPPHVRLVIAGDGHLQSLVTERAQIDDSIIYVGLQAPGSVRAVLESAQVVVVPSQLAETFGLVAVEALAAGRPVIASRRGALQEIVDGAVGWIVEPDAKGLRLALQEALSPEAGLVHLAEAARSRYVNRYSGAAVVRQLLEEYDRVLRHHGSS